MPDGGSRYLVLVGVAAICLVPTACGGGTSTRRTTATTAVVARSAKACVLSARQKRAVAIAERDIRRLHRLEAPLEHYSQKGTPAMEAQTGKVLMDIGRVGLPINTRARLLRLAKSAAGLCGLCFGAFEAEEPAIESRFGHPQCTGR